LWVSRRDLIRSFSIDSISGFAIRNFWGTDESDIGQATVRVQRPIFRLPRNVHLPPQRDKRARRMPATTTAETLALTSTQVIVHPLVLLSAVDHYNRAAKGTKKRVVGILLGQNNGSTINVANSFAGTTPLRNTLTHL
jgi:hypothetical protein